MKYSGVIVGLLTAVNWSCVLFAYFRTGADKALGGCATVACAVDSVIVAMYLLWVAFKWFHDDAADDKTTSPHATVLLGKGTGLAVGVVADRSVQVEFRSGDVDEIMMSLGYIYHDQVRFWTAPDNEAAQEAAR